MNQELNKVFVYGSLRKGMGNHVLLGGSQLVKQDIMMYPGPMVSMGGFPAVIKTNDTLCRIRGEVYLVDATIMQRLDRLEGYPYFYNRELRATKSGYTTWIYFMMEAQHPVIKSHIVEKGDWIHFKEGGDVIQRKA